MSILPFDKLNNYPPIVYKYRTWDDKFHKEIILEQTVFMAKPSSFEDPLDCKLQKRYDLLTEKDIFNKYFQDSKTKNPAWTRQQRRKYAKDWTKKSPMKDKEHIKSMQAKHFEDFDNRLGVLSLTANPKNFSMWEKYSDSHKGFCIGFDSKKMFKYLGGGGEVAYYENLPIIYPFDSFEEEYFKQVFSKEKKWAFEEEYRTLKTYQKELVSIEDRKIQLPKECYKEIIFGAFMSDNLIDEIIYICKQQGFNIDFHKEIINKKNEITLEKMPSHNEQFHESGGVESYDTWCGTSSVALVPTFPNPPPS